MPAETSIPRIGFGAFGLTGEAGLRTMRSAADVVLDAGDFAALAALDAGRRHVDPDWGPSWD